MVRLLAILSLALSFIFEAWKITHGSITYMFFLILGLLLWCISEGWDRAPWKHN